MTPNPLISALLCLLLFLPSPAHSEEKAIGWLVLPQPEKINVVRGTPRPVAVGGEQGEVWYDKESRSSKLRPLDVFTLPESGSEKIASIDTAGAMMEILAESRPGSYRFNSNEERRKYEQGRWKLLVFEKRNDWVKIKFLPQPPWNGRYAWIKLDAGSGAFVSY